MVAGQFVQQYYHVLKSYSKHLHRFYMEDSSFTISGKEGMAESKTAKGQAIQTILTDHLPEAQADCQSFEAQLVCVPGLAAQDPYYNGTPILIQAAGALLTSGKSYTFTQTFFLAPFGGANRGPGYYVANDILRLTPNDGRPALENGFAPVAALALDAVADKPAEVVAPPPAHRSVTPPPAPAAAPAVPQPEPAAPAAPKAAPAPVLPKTPAPVIEKPAPPSPASVVAAAASAAATAATAPAAPAPSSPPRVAQPTAKPADTLPTTTTSAPPSPSPAINPNLTWSERVKLSTAGKAAPAAKAATTAASAATAAITPSPAPAPKPTLPAAAPTPSPAPTAPAPTPDAPLPTLPTSPTKAPEANGTPALAPHDEPPTNTAMVQDLPESTPQEVLDLLAQFGPVKGGVDGISLKPYKDKWTAYLDFETREALDLAVAAELYVGELRVRVVEKRSMHGKGSRGRGGSGARFGAGRGERRADSFGRRPPAPSGLANGGPADRPPRSGRGAFHSGEARPEGVEGERTRPEGGRGEGRGRRGGRGSGRGRGRNADGPRAASPGPSAAPAAAGEA